MPNKNLTYWSDLEQETETCGITIPLSRQINLLARLLGETIVQHSSDAMLTLVEQLRQQCKLAEQTQDRTILTQLAKQLENLSEDKMQWLLRVYTLFFHLVNQAEIQEMIRINHERELEEEPDAPRKESIAAAIYQLKQQGLTLDEVLALINSQDIVFTLTAHPTEARRQSVLYKQQHIAKLLNRLNQNIDRQEQAETIHQLQHYIILLLYTDNVRHKNLTVADEVRNGIHFLRTTIWRSIPTIYQDIKYALRTYYDHELQEHEIVLCYRSWIGGDCDGNPFITPEVVQRTLQQQRKAAIKNYLVKLSELRTELSISQYKIEVPKSLQQSLEKNASRFQLDSHNPAHFKSEPYRVKISYIIGNLVACLAAINGEANAEQTVIAQSYNTDTFLADLLIIQTSLRDANLLHLASFKPLVDIIIQAKTFGLHLAALDIRQHSEVHENFVREVLQQSQNINNYAELTEDDKVQCLSDLLKRDLQVDVGTLTLSQPSEHLWQVFTILKQTERAAIGSYIISMTHDVSDVLEVLLIAKLVGLWCYKQGRVTSELDVVPLFETVDDLQRIEALLEGMFNNDVYALQLLARQDFQESMLGYSDSSKDGGVCMAASILHHAQATIAKVCQKYDINFRIFHGRGGSAGRGGIKPYEAIMAMPPMSQNGRMRVTEQGEVISFHYELDSMARRHYEQTLYAMLLATANKKQQSSTPIGQAYVDVIAEASMQKYRQLIQHDDFWQWYINVTPVEYISKLPIASRPVSRKAASEVDFSG
jgi:phosphoenolpyruvate carboxylase